MSASDKGTLRLRLLALPTADQVNLLKVAVHLMPAYRNASDFHDGSLAYEAADILYRARLPLTEADLCELLSTAAHGCGHGADVLPPFQLARDHMRRHGFSPAIAVAIATYRANLPSGNTVHLHLLRRSADLLSVLTPRPQQLDGPLPWIDDVGRRLAVLDDREKRPWQRLVLAMTVSDRPVASAAWQRIASSVVDELGVDHVQTALRDWWPQAGTEVCLERSGGQLLKHFIWLLPLLPAETGEALTSTIATMAWDRKSPPMAVLKPARIYLADCRSARSRRAHALIQAQIDATL
ncbi:MAG: hypothetical protein ACXVGO_14895 [Mycobacterium sp.]